MRILRGTESDILADGALDYPDAVLEQLDVVIASIHSAHGMDADADDAAARARDAPAAVQDLGPRARPATAQPAAVRLPTSRSARRVAASRAAIEVNGDPHRLDMEPRWIRDGARARHPLRALDRRALDAALGNLRCGVDMARRGWLRRGEVLNTLAAAAFAAAVQARREPARLPALARLTAAASARGWCSTRARGFDARAAAALAATARRWATSSAS